MLAIVGGTGLYQLDELTMTEWRSVDSPFGRPSDQLLFGKLHGHDVVFLPRHGRGTGSRRTRSTSARTSTR